MKGQTVWGVRFYRDDNIPDDWVELTLSDAVGSDGGAASVHVVLPETDPPLVAKIFNDEIRNRVQTVPGYADRVFIPALYWDTLREELPFASWPRRALFDRREPDAASRNAHLIGFTMERLENTISLSDLALHIKNTIPLLRKAHGPDREAIYHICAKMAEQLADLHRHRWGFVFGDMSPHNIHVGRNWRDVYFIDTDSYQFSAGKGRYPFPLYGLTPNFISPGANALLNANKMVTPAHDDFVLAIHIFILLTADAGIVCHPFKEEDDFIEQRLFPFETSPPDVNAALVEVYQSFPAAFRDAFRKTFTTSTPVAAQEWATIITDQRRLLWRS